MEGRETEYWRHMHMVQKISAGSIAKTVKSAEWFNHFIDSKLVQKSEQNGGLLNKYCQTMVKSA